MPLTGTLGGPYSQPGSVQPGFAIVQGKAQWVGPFYAITRLGTGAELGGTVNVGVTAAAGFVTSDPSWWIAH